MSGFAGFGAAGGDKKASGGGFAGLGGFGLGASTPSAGAGAGAAASKPAAGGFAGFGAALGNCVYDKQYVKDVTAKPK